MDEILRRCAPQDDGEPKSETQLQVEATLTSKRGPSSGQRPALCRDDNVNRNGRRRRHASVLSAGSRRTPKVFGGTAGDSADARLRGYWVAVGITSFSTMGTGKGPSSRTRSWNLSRSKLAPAAV